MNASDSESGQVNRSNYKLDAAARQDARVARALIGGRNVTLADCVKLALALNAGKSAAVKTPVRTAVDEFLRAILRRGRREATFSFYEQRLAWFIETSIDRTLDDWDRPQLKKALEAMPHGATTVRMTYRAVRALYNWALQQNPPLCAGNPTLGLVIELPEVARNVQFFTVAEVEHILHGMEARFLPAVALQFFAGIRPEEIAPRTNKPRLQWEHVLIEERIIRVPETVAKTGHARIVESLPPALWAWLRRVPATERHGPICTVGADWLIHLMTKLAGRWIQDGIRHTFATYAMALTGNAGQVMAWLGHEGEAATFHNHYRGLATKKQAGGFWKQRPKT